MRSGPPERSSRERHERVNGSLEGPVGPVGRAGEEENTGAAAGQAAERAAGQAWRTESAGPAAQVLELLAGRGELLAVAESLTGGLVAAEITAVPGASRVFRGSVTAYATPLK